MLHAVSAFSETCLAYWDYVLFLKEVLKSGFVCCCCWFGFVLFWVFLLFFSVSRTLCLGAVSEQLACSLFEDVLVLRLLRQQWPRLPSKRPILFQTPSMCGRTLGVSIVNSGNRRIKWSRTVALLADPKPLIAVLSSFRVRSPLKGAELSIPRV